MHQTVHSFLFNISTSEHLDCCLTFFSHYSDQAASWVTGESTFMSCYRTTVSLHHTICTCCGTHPASYGMIAMGTFKGVKWQVCEINFSPQLMLRLSARARVCVCVRVRACACVRERERAMCMHCCTS